MINRALSLRQPWAWLVLNGKGIENRPWRIHYRGDFYIHAAKGMEQEEYEAARVFAALVAPELVLPAPESLARSGIIGRARLVDIIPPCMAPPKGKRPLKSVTRCEKHPWHIAEQYGFVLADVRAVPFTPMAGSLSLFRIPQAIAERLATE